MSRKKPIIQFPWTDFQAGNLDFLIEKYGEYDGRIKAVEDKNDEQDGRLDEDDTLIANLRADLTTETNQRTAADNDLSDRITAEVAARIAGDTTLQNNLNTEATTRANADTTLQTNINNEATTRANADTALQNAITAEATARDNADTTLQNNINSEATTRANADNTLLENIQQEQQNRITMDQGLQAEINAIPIVKANDSTGTAGGDLTSLKVGNTSYTVPQGGQGTTVVANPSGSATANLSKLQVGSTIYDIPAGTKNVLYIFFDKPSDYRVRYVQTDYWTDPSTLTWENAVSATTGISVFGEFLARGIQSSTEAIVFIDAVNYRKTDLSSFDVTDVHGMTGHSNVVVPYIAPEIEVWMNGSSGFNYKARIEWEDYVLYFDYTNTSPNVTEGFLDYRDPEPTFAYIDQYDYPNVLVDNMSGDPYDIRSILDDIGHNKRTKDSLVLYDNYHVFEILDADYDTYNWVVFSGISAASASGMTRTSYVVTVDQISGQGYGTVVKTINETLT